MSTMSSLSEGHWMSDVNSLVLDAPSNLAASASGNILDQTTFLDSEAIPSTIAATNSTLSLTHYQQGAVYVSASICLCYSRVLLLSNWSHQITESSD